MAKSRVALVTGSTSGIGLAIVQALSLRGCSVALNSLDEEGVVSAAIACCKEAGSPQVEHHGADMADRGQIKDLFSFIRGKFGRTPDILVNNAGVQYVNNIEDFPEEKWDFILSVNLTALFFTTKYALPGMRERAWGRIVNISSVHGLVGSVNKSAYVAAKHGVVGLTKVTALETAGSGVTCNAVCPGWVLTPLIEEQIDAIAKKRNISFEEAKVILIGEKHPSKDSVLPEEVASLVQFLCSEEARQVTGSAYPIDGGWTIH